MDLEGSFYIIALIAKIFSLAGIIFYLLTAWGLYMINKKLGEEHAWLSWIPILQIYSFYKAGNKSMVTYFVYPFIAFIIGSILAPFTFFLSILAAYIYFIYCIFVVLNGISIRTGRGAWTTVGLFFIGFIMFPIVGYKLEEKNQSNNKQTNETTSTNDELI